MRGKKPDTFNTSNIPETAAVSGAYATTETKIALNIMENFVQKSELSIVRELISNQAVGIETQIKDIKDSLSGREGRFWIINGIIIAAIVAIFLFALPELYKKDYKDKYDTICYVPR